MITIEKKLDLFTKMVLDTAKKDYEEREAELERSNVKIVEAYKKNVQHNKEKMIEQMTKKGQLEKTRIISKANLEAKQKVLEVKQTLLKNTIGQIRIKAGNYTNQEDYTVLLEKLLFSGLEHFKTDETVKIYMTEKDFGNYKAIMLQKIVAKGYEKDKIEFLKGKDEMIGGAICVQKDNRFKVDYSMSALIESEQIDIGKNLFDALKKAGVEIE